MKVAIAVIKNQQDAILLTQRPLHKIQGGRWEFPGGKIETTETPKTALMRELQEELGLTVINAIYLGDLVYQYPAQQVHFFIFQVNQYQGEPYCRENQLALQWVNLHRLAEIDFPEANQEMLKFILAL